MTDTRDEREWTIWVCPDHGLTTLDGMGECSWKNLKGGCGYVPEEVRVVSLSRLQEAEARADAAEAVVSRVREWAEPKTRMAGAEARRPFVELLSLLDLDPVSGGQQDTDQEPSAQVMDREQGPTEGGGD